MDIKVRLNLLRMEHKGPISTQCQGKCLARGMQNERQAWTTGPAPLLNEEANLFVRLPGNAER